MTIQEILTQVKNGKLDMVKAQEMIAAQQTGGAFAKDSVTVLSKGRIRVNCGGAQVDLTASQAVAVLKKADAIREEIKRHAKGEHRVETGTSSRGGKEDTYEMHYLGKLVVGYRAEQVKAIQAEFAK